jgi:dipeptidyl-peptidase-3
MKKNIGIMAMAAILLTSCGGDKNSAKFEYANEKFADLQMLRYEVKGWESLTLDQKKLVYYLSEAALNGRDILFDQNCKYNLPIRHLLECVYVDYKGDRESEEFKAFEVYLKRVWFSNGIHHHYGELKFLPGCSKEWLWKAISDVPSEKLGFCECDLTKLMDVMFNPDVLAKKVNQADGEDLIVTSACNYYGEGVTQAEAEAFYKAMKERLDPKPVAYVCEGGCCNIDSLMKDARDSGPVMYGMNSRLEKVDGQLVENVWKMGGLYGEAIAKIVYWLEKAVPMAENEQQKTVIEKLIRFYYDGDLKTFDDYCIAWVKDLDSRVDFVCCFTESYGDPLGLKASWESIVNFKDLEATKRTETISNNAQWFEDHSPMDARFKKEECKGISAKVITAAILAGDLYPGTAIGINLPNSDWVRAAHGSKSVTIGNLTEAYAKAAQGNGFNEEFVYSDKEREMIGKYGILTDDLHTDLHECLGHGSGKLLPGVSGDALKAYGSVIEESRADLFGLYYMADQKMIDLGLLPSKDAYKAQYYTYMMNGLMTQLVRIEPGNQIEQAHMRNRSLITHWVLEHAQNDKAVELTKKDGKTYVKVNDYKRLRDLFGELLGEVQRIKSEGDFEAARDLVENYAVKVDPELHAEVLSRYKALNLAPYKGFINPVYTPVLDKDGNITDVTIDYSESFADQSLRYSRDYSHLPLWSAHDGKDID